MKHIGDYTGFLEHPCQCVERFLNAWCPRSYFLDEKEQERDLQLWLEKCLPDVPIVAQYGVAKGKADLVIDDSQIVELKLAFTDENLPEFDRCVGQMERYRQKWVSNKRGAMFLVIVGKSQTEFRSMIHKAIEQLDRGSGGKWFFLVEKIPSQSPD